MKLRLTLHLPINALLGVRWRKGRRQHLSADLQFPIAPPCTWRGSRCCKRLTKRTRLHVKTRCTTILSFLRATAMPPQSRCSIGMSPRSAHQLGHPPREQLKATSHHFLLHYCVQKTISLRIGAPSTDCLPPLFQKVEWRVRVPPHRSCTCSMNLFRPVLRPQTRSSDPEPALPERVRRS